MEMIEKNIAADLAKFAEKELSVYGVENLNGDVLMDIKERIATQAGEDVGAFEMYIEGGEDILEDREVETIAIVIEVRVPGGYYAEDGTYVTYVREEVWLDR